MLYTNKQCYVSVFCLIGAIYYYQTFCLQLFIGCNKGVVGHLFIWSRKQNPAFALIHHHCSKSNLILEGHKRYVLQFISKGYKIKQKCWAVENDFFKNMNVSLGR